MINQKSNKSIKNNFLKQEDKMENYKSLCSFKIEKNYFNKKVKPYLGKINKETLLYQGENNFSIKTRCNGTIDAFPYNGEVNIIIDKCSNKLINKLEELTKNPPMIIHKK